MINYIIFLSKKLMYFSHYNEIFTEFKDTLTQKINGVLFPLGQRIELLYSRYTKPLKIFQHVYLCAA